MRRAWIICSFVLLSCSSNDGSSHGIDVSGHIDARTDAAPPDLHSQADVAMEVAADLPLDLADLSCQDCGAGLECQPTATRCEGNAVTTCLEDGSGWTISEPCPKTTTCDEGICAAWPAGACPDGYACLAEQDCEDATLSCISSCLEGQPVGVSDYLEEIFWCVVTQCEDDWQPESACFKKQRLGLCKSLFDTCTGQCLPDCEKADCGNDGCGGSCGECDDGFFCDPNGKCLCQPDCDGKECGPNGCGAQCGVCTGRKPVCNELQLCVKEDPSPCGDGECSADDEESCFNCPVDCGSCPECGDGQCEAVESCTFCPADCGPCDFGDCCAYHDTSGCEQPDVVTCVCGLEPDCCLFPWSNDCVLLAADCGAGC